MNRASAAVSQEPSSFLDFSPTRAFGQAWALGSRLTWNPPTGVPVHLLLVTGWPAVLAQSAGTEAPLVRQRPGATNRSPAEDAEADAVESARRGLALVPFRRFRARVGGRWWWRRGSEDAGGRARRAPASGPFPAFLDAGCGACVASVAVGNLRPRRRRRTGRLSRPAALSGRRDPVAGSQPGSPAVSEQHVEAQLGKPVTGRRGPQRPRGPQPYTHTRGLPGRARSLSSLSHRTGVRLRIGLRAASPRRLGADHTGPAASAAPPNGPRRRPSTAADPAGPAGGARTAGCAGQGPEWGPGGDAGVASRFAPAKLQTAPPGMLASSRVTRRWSHLISSDENDLPFVLPFLRDACTSVTTARCCHQCGETFLRAVPDEHDKWKTARPGEIQSGPWWTKSTCMPLPRPRI